MFLFLLYFIFKKFENYEKYQTHNSKGRTLEIKPSGKRFVRREDTNQNYMAEVVNIYSAKSKL